MYDQPESEVHEICTVCHNEVRGGFEVREGMIEDGTPVIAIEGTLDRNFNVCDACNDVICFHCSTEPESGLCNRCLGRSKRDALDADLLEGRDGNE